jgi:putative transposase
MRDGWRHGYLTLFGIGRMPMRGVARTPGRILKADVSRVHDGWRLNLVVETDCAIRGQAKGLAAGLDWGVSEFATLALEDGSFEAVPNPRHLAEDADALREKQQKLSRLARARKISRRSLKSARKRLARQHAKVANRRKDFLHKQTARLVARHPIIATEEIMVRNMTGSARGTIEQPGRNVAQKAGLNRAILDTAPALFLNMLRYKAEEAGSKFLEAPTRRLKPSQRCPSCGAVRKKSLSEREHVCSCGCRLGRDHAAALVMLNWGLEQIPDAPPLETINPAGTVGGQAVA